MREPDGPRPGPERHEEYWPHDALWVVTGCGVPDHPTYWSCSACARRPLGQNEDDQPTQTPADGPPDSPPPTGGGTTSLITPGDEPGATKEQK